MPTLIAPDRWPAVRKRECFNGLSYRAGIKRRLAQQQVYDYVHGQHVLSAWGCVGDWNAESLIMRPNGAVTTDDGPYVLGWFATPGALGFPQIKVIASYKIDGVSESTADYVYIDFESIGRGAPKLTLVIPRTGGTFTKTIILPAGAEGSTWKVTARLANVGAADTDYFRLLSLSAYFNPPTGLQLLGGDALPSATWRAMSMTYWDGGKAESSTPLVWLMEMQARQYVYRPRPAWHHSFVRPATVDGGAVCWDGYVYFPAKSGTTTTMQVKFGYLFRDNASPTIDVLVDGVVEGTFTVTNFNVFREDTIDITYDWAQGERHVEIRLNADLADLYYVGAHILAQSPTVVGAQTIPASFSPIAWNKIVSGAAIFETTDLDSDNVGLQTLIENCYWLEKNHPSRGLFSDFMHRWIPGDDVYGVRKTTLNPGAFSMADVADTDTTPPWLSDTGRRMHFGGAGDASVRNRYRYYLALTMGKTGQNGMGAFSAPVKCKIVHGSFTGDEIVLGERAQSSPTAERPDVVWAGPFEYGTDLSSGINDLNLDLWRETRGGDTAPILAGALVIGQPRTE